MYIESEIREPLPFINCDLFENFYYSEETEISQKIFLKVFSSLMYHYDHSQIECSSSESITELG